MEQAKKRKFVTLPMDEAEFEALQCLVVKETVAKNTPTTRAEIMRDALNLKAVQITGRKIFE